MSHSVFQTAQIMPVIPSTKTLSSKIPLLPPTVNLHLSPSSSVTTKLRKTLVVKASSAVVDGDTLAALERCFQAAPAADSSGALSSSPSSNVMEGPVMKKEFGANQAVTLERSKLDLTQKQTKSSPEVCAPRSNFLKFFLT